MTKIPISSPHCRYLVNWKSYSMGVSLPRFIWEKKISNVGKPQRNETSN